MSRKFNHDRLDDDRAVRRGERVLRKLVPGRFRACGKPAAPPLIVAYSVLLQVRTHAAAPRTDGMKILLGRAQPSQTLPRVGEWGNPVSPFSCGAGARGNPGFPAHCVRARPSRGRGYGGTRFPYVHVRGGVAWPTPRTGRGDGFSLVGRNFALRRGVLLDRAGALWQRPDVEQTWIWP